MCTQRVPAPSGMGPRRPNPVMAKPQRPCTTLSRPTLPQPSCIMSLIIAAMALAMAPTATPSPWHRHCPCARHVGTGGSLWIFVASASEATLCACCHLSQCADVLFCATGSCDHMWLQVGGHHSNARQPGRAGGRGTRAALAMSWCKAVGAVALVAVACCWLHLCRSACKSRRCSSWRFLACRNFFSSSCSSRLMAVAHCLCTSGTATLRCQRCPAKRHSLLALRRA